MVMLVITRWYLFQKFSNSRCLLLAMEKDGKSSIAQTTCFCKIAVLMDQLANRFSQDLSNYPLVICYIAIEHGHLLWI